MSWSWYAMWELLVPLFLALTLGALMSYFVFRWRRRLVSATEWNGLAKRTQHAEMELANAQAAHEEALNERAVLASRFATLTSDHESSQTELAAATRSIEVLSSELDTSKAEVTRLGVHVDECAEKIRTLEAHIRTAEATISAYVAREDQPDDSP